MLQSKSSTTYKFSWQKVQGAWLPRPPLTLSRGLQITNKNCVNASKIFLKNNKQYLFNAYSSDIAILQGTFHFKLKPVKLFCPPYPWGHHFFLGLSLSFYHFFSTLPALINHSNPFIFQYLALLSIHFPVPRPFYHTHFSSNPRLPGGIGPAEHFDRGIEGKINKSQQSANRQFD